MTELPFEFGAGEEARTLDLYLGKVSLYQLSYSRIEQATSYCCSKKAVLYPHIFSSASTFANIPTSPFQATGHYLQHGCIYMVSNCKMRKCNHVANSTLNHPTHPFNAVIHRMRPPYPLPAQVATSHSPALMHAQCQPTRNSLSIIVAYPCS